MGKRDRLQLLAEESSLKADKKAETTGAEHQAATPTPAHPILRMQRSLGNSVVRRLLSRQVQRAVDYEEGGPLNDELSSQINSKRGSGSSLDSTVQAEMSAAMGHDFSDVSVHTDSQSDYLNKSVGAKAFTTGKDIFFSEGSYQPGSTEGKHLLAHELTHVIHQDGANPSGNLTVGPAHDSYESEADQMATAVTSQPAGVQAQLAVQREEMPEDELETKRDPALQRQEGMDEEEMVMEMRDPALQRETAPEEEEKLQMKRDPALQREAAPEEEEELQMKRDSALQREEMPEDELAQ